MRRKFRVGDRVIYRRVKVSTHPGPRAKHIHPAPRGEMYWYDVDKFWIVDEVLEDGTLRLRTRRGKTHLVDATDRHLRHATWWEKIWYRNRFPRPSGDQPSSTS